MIVKKTRKLSQLLHNEHVGRKVFYFEVLKGKEILCQSTHYSSLELMERGIVKLREQLVKDSDKKYRTSLVETIVYVIIGMAISFIIITLITR